MKKINFKRCFAILSLGFVFLPTLSVSATTYLERTVGGVDQTTSYVKLGSGTRYLKAKASYSNGSAYAFKINAWAPDVSVATLSGVTNGQGEKSKSFTSVGTTSSGANQSYYIRWKGTNTSSATVKFTN
jgi:hypothetical protein